MSRGEGSGRVFERCCESPEISVSAFREVAPGTGTPVSVPTRWTARTDDLALTAFDTIA
jgi:hypothetical protein